MIELARSWTDELVDAEEALVRHEGSAEEAMALAAQAARLAVDADDALVAVPQGDHFVCHGSLGPAIPAAGARVPLAGGLVERCLSEQRILFVDDLAQEQRARPASALRPVQGALLLVPVMSHQNALGVLVVYRSSTRAFGPEEGNRLRVLASIAGLAISRSHERRQQHRLEGHILRSPLGLIVFDGRGNLLRANRKACEILGRPERELLELGWEALTARDGTSFGGLVAEVVSGHRDAAECELRLELPDGSVNWASAVTTVVMGEGGGVSYGVVQLKDLTAGVIAEERARRSAALLEAFSETLPVAMGVAEFLGDDLRIIRANHTLANQVGMDLHQLRGRRVSELPVSQVSAKRVLTFVAEAVHGGQVVRFELDSGVTGRHFDCYAASVKGIREGPPMVCFAAVDTTDSRQFQSRLIDTERLANIGRLSAQIVHDLSNPITYITSNLAMLGEELLTLPPEVPKESAAFMRTAVAEAREGATRVCSLIREVLELARPARTRRGPADVRDVVEGALRIARGQILGRARVVTELDDAPTAAIDPSRLGQVVLNLIVNAAQAIPEGDPGAHTIRVRVRAVDDGVSLEVSDTGCGIPKETLERLFTPFFTTKPAGVGNGLGLVSCKEYVQDAGGRIEVESEPGRGTTFRVVLPIFDGAAPLLGPRLVPA
ncbi:MAG: PAS domain-containing protein [Deltaproteobacteria bacterium]|nr:PAS domain-containing protein [Deltaproteobacteria bacterium]